MTSQLPSIPLLLKTLFLWKPQDSRSAFVLIWIIRIITFSLVFRSFVGPYILRLLSSRLRVQSVSLRSIRGIYFRAGPGILHVERVGLGYHRPSSAGASRFSIRVEGVRLEVTKTEGRVGKAVVPKRRRGPRLADLAPFPLAVHAWVAVRVAGCWIYASLEPFVRPAVRALIVSLFRTAIRALPALTQVLDLEVDSAVVVLQSVPGMELVVRRVNVQTSVAFTQLDNSANPTVVPQPHHKRFASVADMGTRFKNSVRRSWSRAWGSTQVAASLSVRVDELLGFASGPLLTELNISGTDRHTFVVVPNIALSTSVRLDPRQQVERHGLEAHLASDEASIDIDVVQYILKLLKRHEQVDEEDTAAGIPSPEIHTTSEKLPSPAQSPPLSPPLTSPRFPWASPMSPKSPLMEALSVRFRWKKHPPVRRIRGKESAAQFSILKAVSIDLPGLTLIHRMPLTAQNHPETFKVTLARIKLGITLSHPDRIPLHRQWLGRTGAPGDPLTPDVYALAFSVNQAALDRVGSGMVVDHLRVISLGHTHLTTLVSQWPSPWITGPTFLTGDPNSQFVIVDVSLGKIEITEHLEAIQKHLDHVKPPKAPKGADSFSPFPPVLSPVPRIAFGFHMHEVSLRLIAANPAEDGCSPFALEAHTDGFSMTAESRFQMVPDHKFSKLPTDPDRPRLQMDMEMQATLQGGFININHAAGDSSAGALGLSIYPPEPVLSMEPIQLSGSGHAFGEMAEEGGSVTIDVPSMFFDTHCACDAVSVELWQPDAVAAVRAIVAIANIKSDTASPEKKSLIPRYLLDSFPAGLSLSLSVGRVMAFVTSPDLAPGEDLNIYRGVAFHTGISFTYCYLRDRHCEGFSDLLTRRQKRLQLSLSTELFATAAGSSTTSALTQTEQALIQVTMWDIALRDALSTRFVADDPYGVGDSSGAYRSQEYLRVEKVTADITLSGKRPGGRPVSGSKDDCAVSIDIKRVRGYLDLAHTYSLLLALQAAKALSPPRRVKTASSKESTITTTVQCNFDKIQLMWEFPLRMKLFSRISSLSIQRPETGLRVKWASVLLAVPQEIVRDGVSQTEWQELLQLPDWSIYVQPDVLPVAIAVEGDSARLRIPFEYVLADLILDINMALKSLKHLTKMVSFGVFSNPSFPVPEEAKSMPNLHLRLGSLIAEAADDEFETRLGLIWRAGFEAARLRMERDDAFEAKVSTIRSANNENVSTPSREIQSEFQFTSEHTVSVAEARSRLFQVHSGAWKSQIRHDHVRQIRRQEDITHNATHTVPFPDSLDGDLITMKPTPPIPPLLRIVFGDLSLHLTRPSFATNHLADFLFREGAGMPRDTEYSLLIPMRLNFLVSSFSVSCREYPLPMLNIPPHSKKDMPGLEFDSDIVIAEEMGSTKTVEWINCAIVKAHTGVHGASPLCITIPKTLNPVKTYANPTIRVKTDDVTDFAWGVSYAPATQDIMRVIDTLSHAPRDSSPPIGFWDKLRLVFHWRIQVLFENEVHLHMKGSHDPEGLKGTGAGFALCWQGSPQLLLNQPNDQNELLQVVSDSVMIIIPNLEDTYGESTLGANTTPRSPTSPVSKSNRSRRVCAKFCSGTRFGVGTVLERTCGPDCPRCSGEPFHRQCRFFEFKPHHQVTLELKERRPVEKTVEDSYNGFRSDFIHLSISLTSSLHQNKDNNSSIHLSPEVFSHFWAWWHLFDGKSLPIRQGPRYKHKRPLSPKFGQHLATIKYRIDVPALFLTHVYADESRDAWADGVTPFVGVKAMTRHFQADMHQRTTESTIIAPDGTHKKVIHKPFDAVEVVMKELDLRALLAIFDTPLKQAVQVEPNNMENAYRKRADMPTVEPDSPWLDLDDFADIDWSSKDTPQVHLLPAVACPRFTYFKQTTACTSETRVETSKFGTENSHVCLLGKEASVPQVQIDIALNRIQELRNMSSNGIDPCMPTSPVLQDSTDTNYMISLLEDYVAHLRQVDAQSRSLPSNGSQYYMPVDFVSPDEWGDFDNVYQVHCPRIYLDNSIRDIMMQYYYCSRSKRGIEYHMATRAVKFIRDQAAAAAEKLQHEPSVRKERRSTAASATQAAVQNVRKLLGGDILASTSVESSPEPLFHTLDNTDPLKGWSEGVSLSKGHFCLLLKPQFILRNEKAADATEGVCVLAAVQGKLQTYNIMDDANADDPVSGKVMSRNFASLSGLQAFSPSAINKSGLGVVPLEVLIDLRCGSHYFDRLVPQTDATFHYDKFNRLRLRNEATSALTRKNDVDDQLHNHLHSQNDLVRIHVPRFTVSANDRHFQSISNIVTNLLLFSNAAHKTRAERLEKMLFSYDFTNLGSAADVVAKFQARLRMSAETRKEAEKKLRTLGADGQVERFKIKAHMLLLGEELDYVFEAIKLAQDKAAGQAAQKSALLLHASSSEISWRMIDRQEQLLAKLAVRDIHFRWLNRQDSSTVNQLVFGDLQAFDGAADAEWTEILSKCDESSNHPLVKRKLFCEAKWSVLPPVGGITIYQSFELMLHPMRLQLDTRVGRKILEYLWPSRRKRANNRTITLSTPEIDTLGLPPSPSSPNGPQVSHRPSPTRRMSEDVSPRASDSSRLTVPGLRKTPTSRSYSDLRKAASSSLQVPGLPRTRSTDMLISPAMIPGPAYRVSEDARERLPFRREADDATVMKTRSSQKTFVWVKVSSLHVLLSIMKEDSFLCRDARIQTRDLEYRNQTWSFEELVEQFIPSGRNWKGWVKMAFNQPLVPVLPVARELISKTKWMNTKHHESNRRGTMVRVASSTNGLRQRTMSTFTSREKAHEKTPLYKGQNLSSLGLVTAEPEPMVPESEADEATVRKPRNKLLKVFKRRRASKTRDSVDSTDSARTTSTKSSWSPEAEVPPDTARPFVVHSDSVA